MSEQYTIVVYYQRTSYGGRWWWWMCLLIFTQNGATIFRSITFVASIFITCLHNMQSNTVYMHTIA